MSAPTTTETKIDARWVDTEPPLYMVIPTAVSARAKPTTAAGC